MFKIRASFAVKSAISSHLTKVHGVCLRQLPATLPVRLQSSTSASSQDVVIVNRVNAITTIGINRPEKRNCVNLETAQKLHEAFKNFEQDASSPVAILHGIGGYFCAGLDLKEVSQFPKDFIHDKYNPRNEEGCGPMGPSRRIFAKPVIAAVDGYAVAGGLEIALMCDLRVVEESAVMGVFCRRFGVPLIDGGTVRLPHLIGLSRALDMILTGRPVKGPEAFKFGLANRLVSNGTCLEEAITLAESLTKYPQECMNRDRLSANNAMYCSKSFQEAVTFEMERGLPVIHKESVAGASSFVDGMGRHGSFKLKDKN